MTEQRRAGCTAPTARQSSTACSPPCLSATGSVSPSRRSRRTQTIRPRPLDERPLPDPSLTRVYRLEATLGEPLDLGDVAQGRRRIVPLTGGTFTGPELNGTLLPGVSADWQIDLPDGTALAAGTTFRGKTGPSGGSAATPPRCRDGRAAAAWQARPATVEGGR